MSGDNLAEYMLKDKISVYQQHCSNLSGFDNNTYNRTQVLNVLMWLESQGIYIDRDVYNHQTKIWDYRNSEPTDCVTFDCGGFEFEDWMPETIAYTIENIY